MSDRRAGLVKALPFLIIIGLMPKGSFGAELTLYEHTFTRSKGTPLTERVSFDIPAPAEEYRVYVINGSADGSMRCSSANVDINGKAAVKPSDLNQQVYTFERETILGMTNVMEARLRSKPGCSLNIRITGIDNTPPAISITNPHDGDILGTPVNTVTGTINDPYATVWINGTVGTNHGETYGGETTLAYGTNVITVKATDYYTNSSTESIRVVMDDVKPVIAIGPTPEYTADKTIDIKGAIEDLTATTVSIQGKSVTVAAGGGPYTFTVELTEGLNTLTVKAVDGAGNTSEETRTITLDTIAPEVKITSPADGAYIAAHTTGVTGTVEDATPVSVSVNGADAAVSGFSFNLSSITLTEVSNTITATATDAAGNTGSNAITVTADTIAPVITLEPLQEYLSATTVELKGTISDATATAVTLQGQNISVPAGGGPFIFTADLSVEGSNMLTVSATDSAGNTSQASATTTRDTVSPVATITVPSDGAYIAALATEVAGSIIDATPATVQVNGQVAVVSGDSFSVASVTLVEGPNTISATATDAAGNTGTDEITVTADTIAPVITLEPLPVYISATTVQLAGTINDATATTVFLRGHTVSVPAGGGPFTFTVELAIEGLNTITVTATDSAGNTSTQDAATTRDTVPPVVKITAPLDGAFIGQLGASVSGTVADATPTTVSVNGTDGTVSSGMFTVPSISIIEGINIIRATATDAAGNTGLDEITVTADTIPPAITIDPLPEYTGATPITVTGRIDDATAVTATLQGKDVSIPVGGGMFSFSADLIEGMNALTVSAVDSAGNSSQETRTTILDTIPPVVDITNPNDGDFLAEAFTSVAGSVADATPFTVSVNGTDAVLNGSAFAIDTLSLVEGSNTITATATDSAGNTGSSEIAVISDVTAPVITIEPLPQYTATPTIELKGTVTDLTETTVSIQGSSMTVPAGGGPFTFPVTLTEGPNTLTVSAVDGAGNTSEESVSTILDTIPPSLSITSPTGGSYLSMITTPVSGTVTDATPVTVSINGRSAVITDTQYNVVSVSLTEGVNAIKATATDAAGNISTTDITVIADTIPPVVTITTPQDGMKTNVTVRTVSGTVTDASPIRTANLNGTPLTFASPDYSIDHTLEEGLNTLIVEATDMAGNTGSSSITVTLDTIPPDPPIIDDHPELTNQIQMTITGSAEALSLVKIAGQGEDYADAAGAFEIPITLNADVMNDFSATATDDVGNESLPTTFSILQDSTPPFVTDFKLLADPKVTLSIPLSITFSEELNAATINTSSITLVNASGAVDGTLSISGSISGTSVVYTPSTDLAANEVYTITVNSDITDKAGNHLDPVFTAEFETLRGPAFILGEVYDDTLSRPLEGSTAEVLAVNDEAPEQSLVAVSDDRGRFSMRYDGVTGSAVLWIYKEGYTSVLRRAMLQPNASHKIFDARLTPVQTKSMTAAEGGSVGAGDTALAVPANTLPGDMDVSFAELGAQGMGYRLPIGWSPLYGVDTAPWGVELATPATLIMKNYWGFASSEFVTARFDSQALAWVSVPAAVTADTITIEVNTLGQYFILIPDIVPEMPPIPQTAGEAIMPSMATMPDSGTADVAVNPPSVVSKEGVRGLTTVVLTTQNIVPSGTHLEARISEKYTLTNGHVVTTEPFTMDITAYAKPDDGDDMTLVAEFPATPSRYYPLGTLAFGSVNIDMGLPLQEETTDENVIGNNGGTIIGADGTEIIIPPDILTDGTVITLEELGEGDLPVSTPAGLTFIGAFTLSMNGGSFLSGAFPQFVLPASVNEGDTVIITRVMDMHGISAQATVAVGHAGGGRIVIDRCIAQQCIASGSFAFYVAGSPLADITGQVTKNTLPAADILVDIDNLPFRALTDTLGMYHIISFEGNWLVTATEPGTGLAASSSGTISAGNSLTVNLTLLSSRPEVVSVMPLDKSLSVDLTTNIEVTLSEPVDPATVGIASFQVLEELPGISDPPAQVSGRISLTAGNTVLVFTPEMDLVANTIYRIRLSEAIIDTYGDPLVPFDSVFTTAEVLGREALEPGALKAGLPDADGFITIRGGQGLTPPESEVVFFNRSKSIMVSVISELDGSFVGMIRGDIGDRIEVQIEDLLGNTTILDPGILQDPDGTAAVGPDGGTIYGPGGITTYIPDGAYDEALAIRVAMVSEDAVSEVRMHPELKTAGVFQIESGGAIPNKELKISMPAPDWITPQHQILLAKVINIRGVEELTLACPAVLKDGKIYSTSPPFEGVMGDGTYELVSWIDPEKGVAYVKVDVWKSFPVYTYVNGDYLFLYDVPYQTKKTIVVTIPVNRTYNVDLTTLDGEVLDTVSITGPPERGEFYPETIDLTYDPEPPTISTVSIPDGSMDVFPYEGFITVGFSEALDPATVNSDTVSVQDSSGKTVEGNIYLADNGTTIVFDPKYGYKYCETYTFRIDGVKDWGGNLLQGQTGNGYSATFSTFCPRMLASAPVPVAMAIDTYKNYVAVKGWNPESPVDIVHSSHLWVFDVSDPADPVLRGDIGMGGYMQDLKVLEDATVFDYAGNAITGDFAVAVGGRVKTYSALDLVDITDPASMKALGEAYLSWNPRFGKPVNYVPSQAGASYSVTLLGTNAYVATYGIGIQAVNLLEVRLPKTSYGWDVISAMQEKALGGTFTGSSYRSVSKVRNNILAVKNGTLSILGPSLNILGQLGSLNYPYLVEGVAAFPIDVDNDGRTGTDEDNDGDLNFSTDESFDLAFISTVDGIVVVDVTAPSAPRKIDMIPVPSGIVKVDREKRLAYTTGMSIISLKALSLNTPPDQMGLRDADGDNIDDRLLYAMPEASGMDIAMSEDRSLAYIADYSRDEFKVVLVTLEGEGLIMANPERFKLQRMYQLGQFDSSVPGSPGLGYVDTFKTFNFYLKKELKVTAKILDRDQNEIGTLVPSQTLPRGGYSFLVDYETAVQAGVNPLSSPEFFVRLDVSSEDGSETDSVLYTGKLAETKVGKRLGQVIVHDVLIQEGTLNLSRRDISLKGRGPEPAFSRTYSNRSSIRESSTLGPGWSHSLDMELRPLSSMEISSGSVPDWVPPLRGRFFDSGDIPDQPVEWTAVAVNGTIFKKYNGTWYAERGRHGTLDQNNNGEFIYTSKDGTKYTYDYPSQFKPTSITSIQDRNGNTMRFAYDSGGDLMAVTDAAGRTLNFEYTTVQAASGDDGKRISKVRGPDHIEMTFTYNAFGMLRSVKRADRVETYEYEQEAGILGGDYNLIKTTDARGNSHIYDYFDAGELDPNLGTYIKAFKPQDVVRSVQYPDANSAVFAYDVSAGNKRIVTDLRGNDTVYTLNSYGNPAKIEEPLGKTTLMTWSIDEGLDDNVMTSKTDARRNTTHYDYDAKGNITKETDPYGNSIATTWNQKYSLPESRTDRNGVVRTWLYDDNGNLLERKDGDDKVTRYTYYVTGEMKTMTDPNQNTTQYTYDRYGNPDTVTGVEGSVTDYDYDVRGRLAAATDPNNNTTTYTYDDLDYPDTIVHPAITAYSLPSTSGTVQDFEYDAVGNLLSETNRNGLTLTYTYTPRNQVKTISRNVGGMKTFVYDANGNLTSETDWIGVATTHTYNALNRRDSTTNRLGHTMSMTYDLEGNLTGVTDYEGNVTTYAYDNLNRLTDTWQPALPGRTAGNIHNTYYLEADPETNLKTVTDQEGNTTAYEYNGRYLRTKRTNALNGVYTWEYDDSGNLVKETDEETKYTGYEYDGQNRRTAGVQMGNIRTEYRHDANGNVTHVIDARGKDTETRYDAWNRAYLVIDPGQKQTKTEYDGEGNRVKEIDGNTNARTWLRDERGLVTTYTDAEERSTLYTYDLNGNVETVTDARGAATKKTYDGEDRELATTEAMGTPDARTAEVLERDMMGNPLRVKDYNGNVTVTEYNALNLPWKVYDPAPFDTQYTETTYYRTGKVKSVRDRRGNSTGYEYDALGRETKVTDALSRTIEKTYDKVGNAKTVKDKRGIITENFYDDLHRLIRTERAGTRLVTNEYDAVGNLRFVTDANNNTTENIYNDRNLLEKTIFADSTFETRTYDGVGNPLTVTDEEGKVSTYTYDRENRRTSTEFAGELTEKFYDEVGNLTDIVKPEGTIRHMDYDYLNRMITVVDDPVSEENAGGLGLTTRYEYDANGNLRHQYDARNNHVEYTYDELNRKTQHIQYKSSGNLVTAFTEYDAEGNLTSMTDPNGNTFTYAYDALNRRTDASYPDTGLPFNTLTHITTGYDANNNVTSNTETKKAADGSTVTDITTNTYDSFDRLDASTQRGLLVDYAYDANGNRTLVSTPSGNTTYTYDRRNRLETATAGSDVTTYTYYPDGKKDTVTYPNGTDVKYIYHPTNRIETITNKVTADGTIISRYAYTYDHNGNRLSQVETQGTDTETTTYTYDGADRMTSYTVEDVLNTTLTEYTFEGYNRKTETVSVGGMPIKSLTYVYDETDWLTSVDDSVSGKLITYAYDNNGNTILKTDSTLVDDDITFTYDARNQLVETKRGPPGGETILGRYDYNAAGLRVRHRVSERGDVDYYYDDNAVIEEHNASNGSLLAHYRYADRLLSLDTGISTQYYHHDALGSTVNLTGTSGAVEVRYKLDPWGHIRSRTGTSVNRQIFTGQEHDENTGLIYFGARYYDPDTARFITQDSYLGEPGTPPSLHRYLYAYGNPTVYVDLYGYEANPLITGNVYYETDAFSGFNPTIDTGNQTVDELIAGAIGTYNMIPGALNYATYVASTHLLIGSAITGKPVDEIDAEILNLAVTLGPQAQILQVGRGGPGLRALVGNIRKLENSRIAKLTREAASGFKEFGKKSLESLKTTLRKTIKKLKTSHLAEEAGNLELNTKLSIRKSKKWKYKEGWDYERVQKEVTRKPHGQRPAPEKYLKKSYIENHLKKFEEGAGFLIDEDELLLQSKYAHYGKDSKFISTKDELDTVIEKYKQSGDISIIEDFMGYERGSLKGKKIYRQNLRQEDMRNLRMPSGNEKGARKLWQPGGKTKPGNALEAVVDPIDKAVLDPLEEIPW